MKIPLPIFISIVTALGLGGCASNSLRVMDESTLNTRKGSEPEIQVVTNASIGSTVLKQFDIKETHNPTYLLDASVIEKIGIGAKVVLKKGTSLIPAMLGDEKCFLTADKAYHDLLAGPYRSVCLFDADENQYFESFKFAPGIVFIEKDLTDPIRYVMEAKTVETPGSFSYELVLTSVSADLVEMMYREYVDNLARPAFSQNVKYTISDLPTTINFKKAQIEVLSTKGNSLRYKVLSNF